MDKETAKAIRDWIKREDAEMRSYGRNDYERGYRRALTAFTKLVNIAETGDPEAIREYRV